MTWLWALFSRLFKRAPVKPPRADARACVRAGALATLEWFADRIETYVAEGGGNDLKPVDEAWVRRWLVWLERCAFVWAPRTCAKRLSPRPDEPITLKILCARFAVLADILGGARERPVKARMGVQRKFWRRARRRVRRALRPAYAPRLLELSG
jgi:hypothetical protein